MRVPSIPASKSIVRVVHCRICMTERPADVPPVEYARLSVGLTPIGLQVWCDRHDVNVAHFDFDGRPTRVNSTLAGTGFQTIRTSDIPPCEMCARGKVHTH